MPIIVGQDAPKTHKQFLLMANHSPIVRYRRLQVWEFSRVPAALKVVLENMLRFEDGKTVSVEDIKAFGTWAESGGKILEKSHIVQRAY